MLAYYEICGLVIFILIILFVILCLFWYRKKQIKIVSNTSIDSLKTTLINDILSKGFKVNAKGNKIKIIENPFSSAELLFEQKNDQIIIYSYNSPTAIIILLSIFLLFIFIIPAFVIILANNYSSKKLIKDKIQPILDNQIPTRSNIQDLRHTPIVQPEWSGSTMKKDACQYNRAPTSTYSPTKLERQLESLKNKYKNLDVSEIEKNIQNSLKRDIEYVKRELESLKNEYDNLDVTDIEKNIQNGDSQSLETAANLLENIKKQLYEFEKFNNDLKDSKLKLNKLSQRLADSTIDPESYDKAYSDLKTHRKEIEDKLWQLRKKLFKEEYEKPF